MAMATEDALTVVCPICGKDAGKKRGIKYALLSDIMGELGSLRNSIVHNKAIAYKKVEKFKKLKNWFKEGDKIYVNGERFEKIILYIRADINLKIKAYINHGSLLFTKDGKDEDISVSKM